MTYRLFYGVRQALYRGVCLLSNETNAGSYYLITARTSFIFILIY